MKIIYSKIKKQKKATKNRPPNKMKTKQN